MLPRVWQSRQRRSLKKQEAHRSSPFKHGKADDSPGFLLWKLTASWQGKLAGVFGEFGITQTQYAILASLLWFEQQGQPPTQARLVEHARIDKMTLSKAIRKLEKSGLVRREPSGLFTVPLSPSSVPTTNSSPASRSGRWNPGRRWPFPSSPAIKHDDALLDRRCVERIRPPRRGWWIQPIERNEAR